MDATSLRRQLLLSSAVLVGALSAYGRRAYAACTLDATPPGSSTYHCSGSAAVNTATQNINHINAEVITNPGFGVNAASGNGINITGDGALSFTDVNFSNITAAQAALYVQSNGDIVAGNEGSITINTTGALRGGDRGLYAVNYGSGSTIITVDGDVTGTGLFGLAAQNGNGFFGVYTGRNLSVTTGAGTTISGGFIGIRADNYGSGATNVTANGNVYGGTTGIAALNFGTDLTVTTGMGTKVVAGDTGISAINYGSGALTIIVNGDVTGGETHVPIEQDDGVYACHGIGFHACGAGGGPITIIVGSDSHVTSNGDGADDFAIQVVGDRGDVTVAGTLNGGAGGAVAFDQLTSLDDRFELQPGAVVNGKVLAGPGTDTFVLGGEGEASFDVGTIGAGLQYQSFEMFLKRDEGHWILTGTNTGIAAWTVTGGILSVDATMPNTLFTASNATLGGSGIIGGLTGIGGLIVAPGNSIGTLTSNGNVVFGPTSTFEVEANAAGQADKLVVKGTVNLTGSVLNVLAAKGNYEPITKYLIIDNDGNDKVEGAFANVTVNNLFLTPLVTYTGDDGNDVVLTLLRTIVPRKGDGYASFCTLADTRNQCNVAHALDQFPFANPLFQAVLLQTSEAGVRQALDALSGEVHATVSGVLADESRYVREAVLGRMIQATYTNNAGQLASLGAGGPQVASLDSHAMLLGYDDKSSGVIPASYGPTLAFWTNAFGAWGNFDGNRNAASANRNLGGFVSGMDARMNGTWRLGVAAGYSQSDISVDARHSGADVNSFHLAGYAGGMAGPLALRYGGAWAWNDIDTSRAVIFPGFFEREKASYNADTGQIFGEVAYPMAMGGMALEPFAGIADAKVDTDSFKEHGKLAALSSRGFDDNVGSSTLGLRAAATMHWDGMILTPHVSAAWQHAFDDVTPEAALAFASTGTGFDVTGVPLAQNSALIEAGLDFNVSPTALLGVSYSGQLASDLVDNSVKGRFTWMF